MPWLGPTPAVEIFQGDERFADHGDGGIPRAFTIDDRRRTFAVGAEDQGSAFRAFRWNL